MFRNRGDAGRLLGERLRSVVTGPAAVLGLPRGGIPVAAEVAKALGAPLDVIVVRKLGVPHQPELGFGALGEDDIKITNDEVVRMAGLTAEAMAAVEADERAEVERRAKRFRGGRARIPVAGRVAIIVDDGIATGSTARAACRVARLQGAERVVLAVPVAPPGWTERLRGEADAFVCLATPEPFFAVGQFYDDFTQTTDDEVRDLLAESTAAERDRSADPVAFDEEVTFDAGPVRLTGRLTVPGGASGIVLFVHGSGSSRHSPRNRFVAQALNEGQLATFLFDLLTTDEEADRSNVFDVELLAGRLVDATRWISDRPPTSGLGVGYFGASTGAAAALWASAEPDASVAAVVSRGGRPDLAGPRLPRVRAPTLLIVGGRDEVVLDLNRRAYNGLACEKRLEVVPGATHLFEEPGTLEAAAALARNWFVSHLARDRMRQER